MKILIGLSSVLFHVVLFIISSVIIAVWFFEPLTNDPLEIILIPIRAIIPYAVMGVIALLVTFFLKRRYKVNNCKKKHIWARISLIVQLVTFTLIMSIVFKYFTI